MPASTGSEILRDAAQRLKYLLLLNVRAVVNTAQSLIDQTKAIQC